MTERNLVYPYKRGRVQVHFAEQGRTHTEFADDADINKIMARYVTTGQLPPVRHGQPFYGDFTLATDFQTCLARVEEARGAFDRLPSAVRLMCSNDPAQFLARLSDDDSRALMVDAGLQLEIPGTEPQTPVTEPAPAPTAPVDPPPESPPAPA